MILVGHRYLPDWSRLCAMADRVPDPGGYFLRAISSPGDGAYMAECTQQGTKGVGVLVSLEEARRLFNLIGKPVRLVIEGENPQEVRIELAGPDLVEGQ